MGHKRLPPTQLKDFFGASSNRLQDLIKVSAAGARPLPAWHDHLFKLILV
jgi:hypothetical protein